MTIEAFTSAVGETPDLLRSAKGKRFLDTFVALAMLAAIWPLFLAVALAVKLSSPSSCKDVSAVASAPSQWLSSVRCI